MHRHTLSALCLALVVLASAALTYAQPLPNQRYLPLIVVAGARPTFSGEGTFYGATGAGNCSFEASPGDLMVGAMNQADYNNAQLCGAFVEVSGPRGTVVVRIVDRCPECKRGDIDLSLEAFTRLADPSVGRIPIRWQIVSPAALAGPISYRFKEGSSQYWTAVQIRNHRNPVARVERRTASGAWALIGRTEYNYFVDAGGMGAGPYTFRITDIYGNSVIESGVALRAGAVVPGTGQFPVAP